MTLEQLLETCESVDLEDSSECVRTMAKVRRAIVDMLGAALPCGFIKPTVIDGEVWGGDITFGRSDEARAYAAAIIRAADKADGGES